MVVDNKKGEKKMMDKKVLDAYNAYVTLTEEIAKLNEQKKLAQAEIKKYHAEQKSLVIESDGFKSQIIEQTSKSLSKELIEKKFGITIGDDCYVVKSKENFRCVKIVNG